MMNRVNAKRMWKGLQGYLWTLIIVFSANVASIVLLTLLDNMNIPFFNLLTYNIFY